eukprot:CAMPEP_0201891430 /NCGR_PEP_ID=MMETSP0902-20130614/34455_1 /ASSEMBLY_ACC=CAM_ASM_000551 /TAXON_ID=420261 /ORGANISM="Thalassiosira antarctica, Strain CCMP982" /LENGTH=48 /DNA_ID= /DNA_START= /DNA_END= /DNA_ORIENTATION=
MIVKAGGARVMSLVDDGTRKMSKSLLGRATRSNEGRYPRGSEGYEMGR